MRKLHVVLVVLFLASIGGCSASSPPDEPGSSLPSSRPSSTVPAPSMAGLRPPRAPYSSSVYDAGLGKVVTLVEDERWMLDVTTNRWEGPTEGVERAFLLYDEATEREIAVNALGGVWSYDTTTDQWLPLSEGHEQPDRQVIAAGMAGATGELVAFLGAGYSNAPVETWSYDVDAETWSRVPTTGPAPLRAAALIVAYDPAIPGFVVLCPVTWEGSGLAAGELRGAWTFNIDDDTWTTIAVPPRLLTGYGPGITMTYQDVTGRVVAFSSGVTDEYDASTNTWYSFDAPGGATKNSDDALPTGLGPLFRIDGSLVYDPSNEQVLLFGGTSRMRAGAAEPDLRNDLWSYDPITHAWTMLLPDTDDDT